MCALIFSHLVALALMLAAAHFTGGRGTQWLRLDKAPHAYSHIKLRLRSGPRAERALDLKDVTEKLLGPRIFLSTIPFILVSWQLSWAFHPQDFCLGSSSFTPIRLLMKAAQLGPFVKGGTPGIPNPPPVVKRIRASQAD